MVREVLTISLGQGGCQLGSAIWEQYLGEHGISSDGSRAENADERYTETFFSESSEGTFVPRNLSIDLDPTTISDIRRGRLGRLFHPEYLVSGTEDAANNFARGMYTVGKEQMEVIMDRVRHMYEFSDKPQGFLLNHAVGGGTGSGLGSALLERLACEYRKQNRIGFEIYPSARQSTCVVEPYNALLATYWLTDHTDVSLVLDNEALYSIAQKRLGIAKPSYANLNRIIAKVVSSTTASLRFDGELNVDLSEFQMNLVPFPRLHWMTTSISPLVSHLKANTAALDTKTITAEVLDSRNFLVSYPDYDHLEDKFMAVCLNYRGDVTGSASTKAVQFCEENSKASFVDWSPTPWKIGLNDVNPATVLGDDIAPTQRSVTMIGNNVAVHRVFDERLVKKYDMMYSQRAYVHWFVGEGMEEGEFEEAREDLAFLQKDYLDCISQASTSSEDESCDEF
jgi:tubulin alpha